MDDGVDGLLAGDHDPDLPPAAGPDLLHEGLEVDHQVAVVADVLAHLVHHEQETELVSLAVHILFDVADKLGDAELVGFGAVEPVPCCLLAHAQDGLQDCDHIVLKEGEGVPGGHPGSAVDLLEGLAELGCFAPALNEALKAGHFQVVAVETDVVVEHLGEDAQHGCPVLVHRSFDVDVEQDRLGGDGDASAQICHHDRVVELVLEVVCGLPALDRPVGQKTGEDLEEMGFAASKESGNPDADMVSRAVQRPRVVVQEGQEVPAEFPGYDVLAQFLVEALRAPVCDLDNAVDWPVDGLFEHVLQQHLYPLPYSRLKAR